MQFYCEVIDRKTNKTLRSFEHVEATDFYYARGIIRDRFMMLHPDLKTTIGM